VIPLVSFILSILKQHHQQQQLVQMIDPVDPEAAAKPVSAAVDSVL
jgi:hypothetical protein